MEYSPNTYRTQLYWGDLMMGDATPRQQELIKAVRGCSALADFGATPERIVTAVQVCSIAMDTPANIAALMVSHGLARVRRELDQMEAVFNAYGPDPFMPRPEPVPAPRGSTFATCRDVLVAVLKSLGSDMVLTRAGDRRVVRDTSGAYVVQESKCDATP